MSVKEKIVNIALEKLWPWFTEYVWPILLRHLLGLIDSAFSGFAQRVKDTFGENSKKRAGEAKAKAADAETKAQNSDPGSKDYHTYKAESEVWRKIAEQYESDIKMLKEKVDELERTSKENVSEEAGKSVPDLNMTVSDITTLEISGITYPLPKLGKLDD